MVAGEIAMALGLPPTNLSFHLKALTHARLLSVEQEGRFQRYRADISMITALIGYLTAECCAGLPEECVSINSFAACGPSAPSKIARKHSSVKA